MEYNSFMKMITLNEAHRGKFILHYYNSNDVLNESMKAYRFIDFINQAKIDMLKYENFELKNNVLYNFYMYINKPNSKIIHSTTMTLLFKLTAGEEIKIKENQIIKVFEYEVGDKNVFSDYYQIKVENHNNKLVFVTDFGERLNSLFEFKDDEIIKIFDGECLKIYKRNYEMYVNLASSKIIPSDEWRCRFFKKKNLHHSIGYIVNRDTYYKFPCNDSFIKFAVFLTENSCYHKLITTIEEAKKTIHLNEMTCAIEIDHSKSIVSDNIFKFNNYVNYKNIIKPLIEKNMKIRTIQHFDIADETKMNIDHEIFNKYEIRKLWRYQLLNRKKFINENIMLIDVINKIISKYL